MLTKFWKLHKHTPIFLFISLLLVILPAYANNSDDYLHFFSSGINYWPTKSTKKLSDIVEKQENSKETAAENKRPSFPWNKFLDPNQKEFFKEGDYTPPETFMELVRNPSDQNIKMWFAYIDKKNELASRLQKRVNEFIQKSNPSIKADSRQILESRIAEFPKSDPNTKRFRFRFYFDSHCPHCKKMMKTMNELQSRGYLVEGRQIDSDPTGEIKLNFPIVKSSQNEITQKDIKSVPVLLVGDLKKKVIFRLSGYQSLETVLKAINQEVK